MTDLSVIVPVYNEAGNIGRLVEEVAESLANYDFELIIVDDGSDDGSVTELSNVAENESRVIAVYLATNFGQTAALAAGSLDIRDFEEINSWLEE